jgi:SAM-dependent methyltransferase
MSEITNNYYSKNSEIFIQTTLEIDMEPIYEKFLPLIPAGGKILDAGCGSGRDSLFFKKQGFNVIAIDNCHDFVKFTSTYAGVEAHCIGFNDINFSNEFSGIWACASLLHLSYENLEDAITRLAKALKTNGIFYCSFKYGTFSGERNGRIFTDMDEERFFKIIDKISNLTILETWITDDQRKDRKVEKWLNVLTKKIQP